jgi:hypothetical protein
MEKVCAYMTIFVLCIIVIGLLKEMYESSEK